jgi:hypothetical protein
MLNLRQTIDNMSKSIQYHPNVMEPPPTCNSESYTWETFCTVKTFYSMYAFNIKNVD